MTDPSSQTGTRAGRDALSARAGAALRRRLPLLGWLRAADASSRRADVLAGLTVAAMLVPQSMAYAALAGMPPVTGLYASTVPLVAYAFLGTSGQLAFGPVAIVSLLTASTLAPLAEGDPGRYVALAAMLAVLVGLIQVALAILRAGRLTTLLSHPVVSGFTSAAAIVIATSQLDKLFGVSIERPDGWLERIGAIASELGATHLPTLVIGIIAVAALLLGRRLGPKVPTALLVVVLATAAVPALGLADAGVAILGDVPGGLPAPSLPTAPVETILALLPGALIIALLSYLEGISVARAVAARTRDRIDPDQELLASGAANLAAGFFQSFPVAGGFSRTAVNHTAGARTPLASLVTASGVLLALLVLAPLFTTLPEVVLAAVVLSAVIRLIDVREAVHAWRIERTDGLALTVTFLATLVLGVELGIGIGIAASFVLSLWRVGNPVIEITEEPGGAVVHVDGVLLPASAARLIDTVEEYLADGDDQGEGRWLVLDLGGVPTADTSGVSAVATIISLARSSDLEIRLTGVRPRVRASLERAHIDVASASTAETRLDASHQVEDAPMDPPAPEPADERALGPTAAR